MTRRVTIYVTTKAGNYLGGYVTEESGNHVSSSDPIYMHVTGADVRILTHEQELARASGK